MHGYHLCFGRQRSLTIEKYNAYPLLSQRQRRIDVAQPTKFWDNHAERYSKRPVPDEAVYQKKLAVTREYLQPHYPEFFLERCHLTSHGRLRHAQCSSRSRQRPFLGRNKKSPCSVPIESYGSPFHTKLHISTKCRILSPNTASNDCSGTLSSSIANCSNVTF